MACIVIYNEANIIAIISIFISMLSVASKSFVFSMGIASNFKQLFFVWLSAVADFFGMFFVVCWVFYEPQDEYLQDAFIVIRNIWLWKLFIFIFPMIGFVSVFLHTLAWNVIIYETNSGCGYKICYGIMGFIASTFGWVLGVIAATLVTEISVWIWIAVLYLKLGIERLPGYHKLSLEFWFTMISWINSAQKHHIGSKYKGCTSYTKSQDKMMRLASLNYTMNNRFNDYRKDSKLHQYLEHNKKSSYLNVTYQGLRINTNKPNNSRFLRKFWQFWSHVWRYFYAF